MQLLFHSNLSVPITNQVVSSNPVHGEVCSIQNNVIKVVSDLRQVWFFPGASVSSTNKTDCHNITEILLKVALNTINKTLTDLFEAIKMADDVVLNFLFYKLPESIEFEICGRMLCEGGTKSKDMASDVTALSCDPLVSIISSFGSESIFGCSG